MYEPENVSNDDEEELFLHPSAAWRVRQIAFLDTCVMPLALKRQYTAVSQQNIDWLFYSNILVWEYVPC